MRVLNDDNLLNDSADLYSHRASLTVNSVDAISEFLLDVSLTIIQNVERPNSVTKIRFKVKYILKPTRFSDGESESFPSKPDHLDGWL